MVVGSPLLGAEEAPGLLTTQHALALRPISTFGNWMFDVVADLTSPLSPRAAQSLLPPQAQAQPKGTAFDTQRERPQSTVMSPLAPPTFAFVAQEKRFSAPPTPSSATFTEMPRFPVSGYFEDEEYMDLKTRHSVMERSAIKARQARLSRTRLGRDVSDYVKVEKALNHSATEIDASADAADERRPGFIALMRAVYPQLPHKPLLFAGLALCVASGVMTPLFSFLLSRVLFEVSAGAQDVRTINIFGGLVLGVAALDGLLLGLKYVIMEAVGMAWITAARTRALSRVLGQDKSWFDKPENGPAQLVQRLVRDGDDARDLIAVVWGQFAVVCAMLGVGLVWAFIRGWQLTLAGLAIAPVFAVTMSVQSSLVARCEARNKRAREEVSRGYYNVSLTTFLPPAR